MLFLVLGLIYFILTIVVLLSVAFVTLIEQKVLGSMQIRLGPNKSGYWGVMQPFADAVKLFCKEVVLGSKFNFNFYLVSPWLSLSLALGLWLLYPMKMGGFDWSLGVFFFLCMSSLSVYPIFWGGWSSNCKYSMLGSLRGVAQVVSYEVSLAMILLSIMWVNSSLDFSVIFNNQIYIWSVVWGFPLCLVWLASSLAEMHRTPYDFSEGESELVSGFNTEYSGGGFTLIFMSEYTSIIFMALVFSVLFLGGWVLWLGVKSVFIVVCYVWIRGSYPRFRYDKLMSLAWKSFLPVSMNMFVLYLSFNLLSI
uniref:NADH-ubiquinone oxidoreductase chain 1 n=1 Tax=Crangonyx forbesi TaxID=111557 RepID=A0A6C0X4Y7_9CRUS|nr:NADH dehydrogenase subunit 1 [Crangonyx forbesi]